MEDAEARFEYLDIDSTEILLPIEVWAKLIQTFPFLNQYTVAPPQVVELATNEPDWQKPNNNDSLPQTTGMGGHSNVARPDTKICDAISR